MFSFVARRLIHFVPVLFVTSIIIFVGVRMLPGDAAVMLAGPSPTPEIVEAIRKSLGLDRSLIEQYFLWMGSLIRGDLGLSLTSGRSIAELLSQRFSGSATLALTGLAASIALGAILGLLSGLRPGTSLDRASAIFRAVNLSMPLFVKSVLLVLFFAVFLRWFPVSGPGRPGAGLASSVSHLFLPTLALALSHGPIIASFFQASLKEVRRADFVTAARAKGLPQRVVIVDYIIRNSLVPVITATGIIFGNLIGGVAVVEVVFAWPGLGSLLVDALGNRDYGVVQAVIAIVVLGFLIANLLADIICALIDPRINNGQA